MAEKEELIQIVGSDRVFDAPAILEEYASDQSFVHLVRPRYVLKPENSEQVKGIVRWANKTLTPLVPVSSGPPHFRGDTVPSTGGSVIVDLSRMKKIMRVDGRNRMAMVEPGVTFTELIPELDKQRLRLNMPLLPRMSKSVIGSVLEREPVVMPKYHWDMVDPLLSTEVIWGSGDTLRTGSAAGTRTLEEQWESGAAQKGESGPGQADWCRIIQGSQGTMGIVTWAAIKCERLPKLEEPFLVASSALDSLSEFVHWLIRLRLANECLILNNSDLATILANKRPEECKKLRDSLPRWVLFFCIAGYEYFPEERVGYQIMDMMDIARRVGLKPTKMIDGISASAILKMLRLPSEEPYWKLRYKGACHDIFFLTTQNKLPELIEVMSDTAVQHGYPAPDIGVYIQSIVQGTSCHCEFNLFFNPKNEAEVNKVRDLSINASQALMARGAFFSRPYGSWSDMAYRRDAETTASLRRVKGIFDPNDVMNPRKLCF